MMMMSNKKSCGIKTRAETRGPYESLLPSALVEAGDGVEVDRSLEGKRLVAAHLSACELGFLVADDNRLSFARGEVERAKERSRLVTCL
jgi:hypothetical protein